MNIWIGRCYILKMLKKAANHLTKFWKGLKIRQKILLSYILILLIPVILIGVISSKYSADIIADETVQLTLNVADKIKNNIEYNFKDMDTIVNSLYSYKNNSTQLTTYLETTAPQTAYSKILIQNQFNDLFMMMSYLRSDLSAIHVYGDNNSEFYYYRKPFQGVSYSRNDSIYIRTIKNGGKTLLTSTHKQFFYDRGDPVFTLSRQILNPSMDKYIAVVLVDYDIRSLHDICQNTNLNLGESVIICNKSGDTIYNTNESELYKKVDPNLLQKLQNQGPQTAYYTYNQNQYLLIRDTTDSSELNIIFMIPLKNIMLKSYKFYFIIIIISLLTLALAIGVSYYFSLFITKPIKNLSAAIKAVESGNISVRADVDSNDEIGNLTKSFNSMVSKINYLIANEYKINLIKKEAELKALMAQVNPHFIYNTLEVISGAAIEYHVPMINEIAKALGQMLRYSIKTKEDIVTLEEELFHLDNYLKIHRFRFEDNLQVIYDIMKEYKKIKVLKLLLQPIVENSIQHGIQKVPRKGIIRIAVSRSLNVLNILISDNGIGMDKDTLLSIKNTLNEDCESSIWKLDEKKSIGLRNVNARLVLHYGEDYKLEIESIYNIGTTVSIKIPIEGKDKTHD